MLRYLTSRILYTLPVLWLVVSVVFLLIHLVPGDPIQQMLGEGAASSDIAAARTKGYLLRPTAPVHRITRTQADQLLAFIPGLTLANRGNPSQDPRLSIRGFGARSAFGVRSMRVMRDGMPLTLPDGQTPIAEQAGNFGDSLDTAPRPFAIDPQPRSIGYIGCTAPQLNRFFAGADPVATPAQS